MEPLLVVTTSVIIATGCQIGHYLHDGHPWHHAIFPRTLREWALPLCPFCWPARALVVACAVLFLVA